MISIEKAQAIIQKEAERLAATLEIEELSLAGSDVEILTGRVLVEDIHAPIDLPAFSNSAMDGYAINDKDIQEEGDASNTYSRPIAVVGESAAGSAPKTLQAGTCMHIFTGAAIPDGATLVVPQENCKYEKEANTISIQLPVQIGDHIRPARQNYAKGDLVCSAGTILTERHIPLLVSLGLTSCLVKRRVRIAICVSGDELQSLGSDLKLGEIYDSNSVYLKLACKRLGCDIVLCEHLVDDYAKTKALLARAAEKSDLVITSGGISVGDKDYIRDVLLEDGEPLIRSVRIKPGKPFTLAYFHNTLLAALPGNPLSVFIIFVWFILPGIYRMQGGEYEMPLIQVEAPEDFHSYPRTRFLFVDINMQKGVEIALLQDQSSAALKNMMYANGVLIVPENTETKKGTPLQVLLIA